MMIRSQKFVTSKHVDLPFSQCNLIVGFIRFIERGRDGFVGLIKRSILSALVYFHIIYNVCYHSMARTEDQNEDAGSPEKLITKTLPCENPHKVHGFVILGEADTVSKSGCQHISKAIDATSVRKGIIRAGGFASLKCANCKKLPLNNGEEKDLSLCLKCGACNCDDHILKHFEIAHSDPHTLCAKVKDWSVRCYKCEIDVPIESSGKLKEGINLLKQEQSKPSKVAPKMTTFDPEMIDGDTETTTQYNRNAIASSALSVSVLRKTPPKTGQLPSPRGLMNLGNTCFMNSVLQCLAQTPFLLDVLLEIAEPGEKATLNINEHERMTVELEKWGMLTESLAFTLREMTRDSSGVFQPSQLLDTLRKKCRTFIGYNQHDAHELLRQLLDNVKTEDIRRYQGHILTYCGLSRKSNPDEVDEKKRALAKSLNQKLTELVNIRPDQVFKGTLVSTVQCTRCHHKSEVIENFLDLSLPVSFEKSFQVQPSTLARRKNVFNDDENRPKSSHQKKKENKAARKAKKLAKFKKRLKDDEVKNVKNAVNDKKDIDESGYSSAKATSPVQNNNIQASIENNRNEILAEALTEVNSSSSSSPIRNDSINEVENSAKIQTPPNTAESPIIEGPKDDTLASTSSCFNSDDADKVKPIEDKGSPSLNSVVNFVDDENVSESDPYSDTPDMRCRLVNSPAAPCDGCSSSSVGSSDDKDEDHDNYDYDIDDDDEAVDGDDDGSAEEENTEDASEDEGFNATLQPPGKYDDGSILSCLAHFTALEILTGNNKVKCDSCTDRQNKDIGENEKKKPVYQPATKQLLINSPPPILILHLKRFQAMYTSLRKVSKPVDFPLILDIAPFCSAKCQNLLVPGQNKILYSLYGIVVHSGSLQGGHYIAYVKVRKPVEKSSYRRLFLPKSANNSVRLEDFTLDSIERKIEEDQNSPSTWYCISDSNVSRVSSEEQVLKREAYLLFYERIF